MANTGNQDQDKDMAAQRAQLADKLLSFNEGGASFLEKAERLIQEYQIVMPSCTVQFKVHQFCVFRIYITSVSRRAYSCARYL